MFFNKINGITGHCISKDCNGITIPFGVFIPEITSKRNIHICRDNKLYRNFVYKDM
ncbi:hypothetical protein SDC9_103509 [bioreactor metagenome]|uniref:Uncharacterized protein n=1 Tax=bioreactor metagenome TaxID=1076179 RepID=A0A645AUB1_9ZZZZ